MSKLAYTFRVLTQENPNVKFVNVKSDEVEVIGKDGSELFFEIPTTIIKWRFYSGDGWKMSGVEGAVDEEKMAEVIGDVVKRFFNK